MISIAITTYNRSGFVIESFINVLDNDYVGEVVIVDDCSDLRIFNNLKAIITRINHVKIRLIRNKRNIGSFLNKMQSVKRCRNEWVLSLDSDNVIDNHFIEKLRGLDLEDDVMYCPESLCRVDNGAVQWSYPEFNNIFIDRVNVVEYVDNINFEIHLNTGNNFFRRDAFLNAVRMADIPANEVVGGDATYITYLWLSAENRTKIVPGLAYGHRVHSESLYMQNVNKGLEFNAKVYQMIRQLSPAIGGFTVDKGFQNMISLSYDYNEYVFNTEPKWRLLEELYNKNFLNAEDYWRTAIPKKIHQIWLGGEIPEKYKILTETWKELNPTWEYKLWTDADVETLNIPNKPLFDSLTNYGPKSDILRYHVLNEFGGVYADTDFECLMPFESLRFLDFFTGIAYQSKVELYPGLIGCTPHHPILEQAIKEIKDKTSISQTANGVLEDISSYFFTRVFFKVVTEYQKDIAALPPDYFYPFPNQKGHEKRDGKKYIKDCSYALHHWAVSWMKK